MRRKPYDEYFFDSDTKETILGLTLYGYLTPIIVFIVYIQDKFKNRTHKKRITKFLYHVANIGVSKSEKDTFLNAGYTLDDEKRDKVYGDILYDGEDFL